MFGLAVALPSQTLLGTPLLVVRQRSLRMEVVRYLGAREVRVIYSEPLTLRRGGHRETTLLLDAAQIAFSLAIHPRGDRFAFLSVHDAEFRADAPDETLMIGTLKVVGLDGRVRSQTPVTYRWEQADVLGWDDGDEPVLLSGPRGEEDWMWKSGAWKRTPMAAAPKTFRALEGRTDAAGRRSSLGFAATPRWTRLGAPADFLMDSVILARSADGGADVSCDAKGIDAVWRGHPGLRREWGPAGTLDYVAPLEFPFVVGRRRGGRPGDFSYGLREEFRGFDVFPADPFVESNLVVLNMRSGEKRVLGEGIRAYAIGP